MPRGKQFDVDDALIKAMNLFWRQGYQATSMQDLVDCMGIGRGSLYATFGDKHRLFVRALRHYDKVWREEWLDDLTRSSPPRRAVLNVFEAAIAIALEHGVFEGCLLINSAMELSPHDPAVSEIVTHAFTEMQEFFRTTIERGKALGEISGRVDAEQTARSLLALFIGLRVLVRSRPEEPLLRAIARQAEELLPLDAMASS